MLFLLKSVQQERYIYGIKHEKKAINRKLINDNFCKKKKSN